MVPYTVQGVYALQKKVFYCMIPVITLVLLVTNAFFGHLIFGSPYGQDINKYSIYVHLQPEWTSYPGNIIFDVTNVWFNPISDTPQRPQNATKMIDDPHDISTLVPYNYNQIQQQHQKSYVELQHEFGDCQTDWKPIPYRYAVDTIRGKIEAIQGVRDVTADPYVVIFPDRPNVMYNLEEHDILMSKGYAQFIPVCTVSESVTSYGYSLEISDPSKGFDVYFVPSITELVDHGSLNFDFYEQSGCYAQNHNSFAGMCHSIHPESGLLIILPDTLEQPLTRVRVTLYELDSTV